LLNSHVFGSLNMLDQMPLGWVRTATYVCRKSDAVGLASVRPIYNRPRKNKDLKSFDISDKFL
jgi:hypothetical protein